VVILSLDYYLLRTCTYFHSVRRVFRYLLDLAETQINILNRKIFLTTSSIPSTMILYNIWYKLRCRSTLGVAEYFQFSKMSSMTAQQLQHRLTLLRGAITMRCSIETYSNTLEKVGKSSPWCPFGRSAVGKARKRLSLAPMWQRYVSFFIPSFLSRAFPFSTVDRPCCSLRSACCCCEN